MVLALTEAFLLLTALQAAGQGVTEPVADSLTEFGTTVANALPGIIAALILLGIGYLVGKIAGWIVTKVSKGLNLDSHWVKTGIGKATSRSGWNMTKIFSTATKWFIYLFFISAAVNVLQFQQVSDAINSVWLWVPNVIAFLIVLVIGSIIADFVGRYLQRELPARGIVGGKTVALVMTGVLYAIVLVVATTQLRIGEEILNSVISALVWGLAAAIAIGFGAGLAYGLREAFPAMIKGSTVIQPAVKPGQKISYNGFAGTVQQVGAFSVILKDESGRTVVVPTKNIADKEIVIESGPSPETQESMTERRSAYTEAA